MPLPLIPPPMPPAPELAEVVLLSAPAPPRLGAFDLANAASTPDSDRLYRSEAELLLPLAQASAAPLPKPPPPAPAWPTEQSIPPSAPPPESDPESPGDDAPPGQAAPAPDSELPPEGTGSLTLQADRQVYEPIRQIVTATGNVQVQFGTTELTADRLWANLFNRHLRAEGNVFFTRNNQLIEGAVATYNLLQGAGTIWEARGELQLQALNNDFANFSSVVNQDSVSMGGRQRTQGTVSQVTSAGGVVLATTDPGNRLGNQQTIIRRVRFESDQIYFDADGWYADELRLTNDPFSPPDLEFRAQNVRLTPLNAEQDELVFSNPRLVLDQRLGIPLTRRRFVLTRGQLPPDAFNPVPTGIGIDGEDRGGLFIEREFNIPVGGPWSVAVAPQFLVSRWLGESQSDLFDPANFGLTARIQGNLSPRASAIGSLSLSGLDLSNWRNRLRASFRTQQLVGTHSLNLEYSYRDRIFNGSLGFQDVQNSIGALLASPAIVLGSSGIVLNYQASGQYVTATTDQADLLPAGTGSGLASLFRFQGVADIGRVFTLWSSKPLPATPTEGMRYTPRPLVPNLGIAVGLRGVATYYTSDNTQNTLEGRVSLFGQLGRLQRNYLDYTQFNIGFSRSLVGGNGSPFFFDRVVDQNVLSGGITQQIYGPFLVGFQTSINVDTGANVDNNIVVEYRRRAYGILLSYSPAQETGFLGFRISDFDWVGRTAPFDADPTDPSDIQVQ